MSRRRSPFWLPVLVCLAGLAPAGAAGESEPPELLPGARGRAITVLNGTETRGIPLTYLGTYEDFAGPGYDLHLVELEGPVGETIGVAAGMSGSPVYIDGKLIGALSYRLGLLPKKAIGGVTPIADVLDSARAGGAARPGSGSNLSPIATPVVVGGMAPGALEWLRPHLEETGLVPVAGGSGGGGADPPAELRPGSPVGVELVRGDMRMAATGTVTWVEGDRVYAFGHPFLGAGRLEMPMVAAEVVHTLADLAGSTKLARVGDEIGAVVEDRQSAIVGRLGQRAPMIPVTVDVEGGDYGRQTFRFEIARHPSLSALLAGTVVVNALRVNAGYTDESTMLVSGTVRLAGLPALPLEMAFAGKGGADPSFAIASEVFSTLSGLAGNPFEELEIEGIDLDVEVRREVVRYRVEEVYYDRGALRPGETLEVTCVLRRYRGDTVTRKLTLELPERLPRRGELVLAVASPPQIDRALGGRLNERLRSAPDLASMVRALEDRGVASELMAVVYQPGGALVSRGEAYAELPPTVERLLGTQAGSASRRKATLSALAQTRLTLDGPVDGGVQKRLRVDRMSTTMENP